MGIVRIKDRKGVVQTFDAKERSHGLVHRMYQQGNQFARKGKTKIEKPFVAQIKPFTPEPPPFVRAFVVKK